jgi:hypothetical protein
MKYRMMDLHVVGLFIACQFESRRPASACENKALTAAGNGDLPILEA